MPALRKNVAGQRVFFGLVNASTGAALTGATVTALVALDTGSQAAAGGSVTELANGQYRFNPSQGDTNGDFVGYLFTATNAIPVHANFVTDMGTLRSATDSSGRVTVITNSDKTGYSIGTGGITSTSFASGAIDAAAIAPDAIGSAELAASAVTEIQAGLATQASLDTLEARLGTPSNLGSGATVAANLVDIESQTDDIGVAGVGLSAIPAVTVGMINANVITDSAIADGAINRATFAADTGLQTIRSNTAQAGTTGTITLDASASASDNFYNETHIYLTGGIGAGQVRAVTAYVGATKVASITPNWTTVPDATSTFAIRPAARADALSAGATDWSTTERQQIRQALGVDGTKTATSGGNLDAVKAKTDQLTFTGANKVDASVRDWLGTAPSALISGRVDANAQAIGTDAVNSTALAASAVTEIQAGLATQASVDTIDDFLDTEIAAIKAKTDNLPASPAAVGSAMTLAADAVNASALAADAVTEIFVGVLRTALTEGYAADGAQPTLEQLAYMLYSAVAQFAVSGTSISTKKIDGTTEAMVFTTDSASSPTSRVRTT